MLKKIELYNKTLAEIEHKRVTAKTEAEQKALIDNLSKTREDMEKSIQKLNAAKAEAEAKPVVNTNKLPKPNNSTVCNPDPPTAVYATHIGATHQVPNIIPISRTTLDQQAYPSQQPYPVSQISPPPQAQQPYPQYAASTAPSYYPPSPIMNEPAFAPEYASPTRSPAPVVTRSHAPVVNSKSPDKLPPAAGGGRAYYKKH